MESAAKGNNNYSCQQVRMLNATSVELRGEFFAYWVVNTSPILFLFSIGLRIIVFNQFCYFYFQVRPITRVSHCDLKCFFGWNITRARWRMQTTRSRADQRHTRSESRHFRCCRLHIDRVDGRRSHLVFMKATMPTNARNYSHAQYPSQCVYTLYFMYHWYIKHNGSSAKWFLYVCHVRLGWGFIFLFNVIWNDICSCKCFGRTLMQVGNVIERLSVHATGAWIISAFVRAVLELYITAAACIFALLCCLVVQLVVFIVLVLSDII